jgi:hypothetical protein
VVRLEASRGLWLLVLGLTVLRLWAAATIPLTEDEAAALDEAAEAAARAASPPSPLSTPQQVDDYGDLDGDLGSGSGES